LGGQASRIVCDHDEFDASSLSECVSSLTRDDAIGGTLSQDPTECLLAALRYLRVRYRPNIRQNVKRSHNRDRDSTARAWKLHGFVPKKVLNFDRLPGGHRGRLRSVSFLSQERVTIDLLRSR
jgi:hypothetical protein